jgi:outer membrane biosynthesis protein TonB
MTEPEEDTKNYEAQFLALISSISGGVMQHLGKVMNPFTGKVERNLPAAREMIDILRMLRTRTRGNLTEREERTLNALISSVQLNYVDEVKAEAEAPKEKPAEEKKEEPQPAKEAETPAEQKGEQPPATPQAEAKSEQPPAEKTQPSRKKTGKQKKSKRSKRAPAEE